MLCQFSVQNFKSFREEAVLDLQAADIGEFSSSLFPTPNQDKFRPLLPVAALYGPNGGGKSVLLEALAALASLVQGPIVSTTTGELHPYGPLRKDCEPFLLDSTSKERPTSFQLYFRTDTSEFRYRLSLLDGRILQESLYQVRLDAKRITPAMVFDRDPTRQTPIQLGKALKQARVVLPNSFKSTLPLLSYVSFSYSIPEINEAADWFKKLYYLDYSNDGTQIPVALLREPERKEAFLQLLHRFDVPIQDYIESEAWDGEGRIYRRIHTVHEAGGKRYGMPLSCESQGTIKLFRLLPMAILALETGGVAIVDDLDTKLHPRLLRALIRLFTNPDTNPNHAQLLFAAQDVSAMCSALLRRDQIWFAAQDGEQVSHIWSLYDLQDARGEKVQPNVSYAQQYLEGRYGAVPYLRRGWTREGEWKGGKPHGNAHGNGGRKFWPNIPLFQQQTAENAGATAADTGKSAWNGGNCC